MNNIFLSFMDTMYLVQFIIGGLLFVLIYHFSKNKNTILSSIIPALPIIFFIGFIYLLYFEGNVLNYIKNCIFTFGCDVLFFILFYFIAINIKNIFLSFCLSFTLYILLIYYLVKNKILV